LTLQPSSQKNAYEHEDLVAEVEASAADPMVKLASQTALDTWKVLKCRDSGRVDIRFDFNEDGDLPCVLEVNTIAGLCPRWLPDHSYLTHIAENNGISYEMLLEQIVESALRR